MVKVNVNINININDINSVVIQVKGWAKTVIQVEVKRLNFLLPSR